MKKYFNRTARFVSVLSVFVVVMIFYIGLMAKIQIDGSKNKVDDSVAYKRQVSVSGLRGEIYDRNGVLLVANSTSYDLIFEYGSIPDTTLEFNRSLLQAIDAIEETGSEDKRVEDYYVLSGTYPHLTYIDALRYSDSEEYKQFEKILQSNGLDPKSTTEEVLVDRLVKKYKLSNELYTNKEITKLLRIRYAMEGIKFGIYKPFVLAKDISMELVTYIEEADIDGANLKVSSARDYKFPGYASHILGRLGKIQEDDAEYYTELGYPMDAYVGTSGCEKEFENYLHGQDGIMEISYASDGSVIKKEHLKAPVSGDDVYLTIDINLQIAAEDKLKETVQSMKYSDSGAVAALDPNTGEVLVMASYPTYDLTRFNDQEYFDMLLADESKPLFDRVLLGQYAPGSIYKVGSALAGLEEGIIDRNTEFYCDGVYPYYHRPTCLGVGTKDGKHRNINVIDALGYSCNCFFFELGRIMGIDAINPYTSRLGLGVSTGIELPERIGTVAGTKFREDNGLAVWEKGDDLSAVIGQSDHTYSPLQIGNFMASVSNGGDRYSLHLLHSVKKFYTKDTVFEYTPSVLDSITISPDSKSALFDGMRAVITSSRSLTSYFSVIDEKVAGKTGTAQVNGKKDFALFSCFAPFDNPEIVGVCVIEQGVNGGNAAIPIATIFDKYFNKDAN